MEDRNLLARKRKSVTWDFKTNWLSQQLSFAQPTDGQKLTKRVKELGEKRSQWVVKTMLTYKLEGIQARDNPIKEPLERRRIGEEPKSVFWYWIFCRIQMFRCWEFKTFDSVSDSINCRLCVIMSQHSLAFDGPGEQCCEENILWLIVPSDFRCYSCVRALQ